METGNAIERGMHNKFRNFRARGDNLALHVDRENIVGLYRFIKMNKNFFPSFRDLREKERCFFNKS